MRNHPDEIQRQRIVDNNSSSTAAVRADLIDVIHGTLSRESESPATLMTFEFRFISTSLSRRIQSATIRLQFADAHSRSELDPEVFRIAPDGSIAVVNFWGYESVNNAKRFLLGACHDTGNLGTTVWVRRIGNCWSRGDWGKLGERNTI